MPKMMMALKFAAGTDGKTKTKVASKTVTSHFDKVKHELTRLQDEVRRLQSDKKELEGDNQDFRDALDDLEGNNQALNNALEASAKEILKLKLEIVMLKAQAKKEAEERGEIIVEVPPEISPPKPPSWSYLSPPTSTPCGATLNRCFPGALPGSILLKTVSAILEAEGLTPENTIYGQSICSDEINNEAGGTARLFTEHWGVNDEHFPLGGIGGAPYVGKTGFGAFSGHVPDGGNVMLLFGPHIGVSDAGELGKYLRHGQACKSTACGAVVGAYGACKAGKGRESDASDMQQVWLEKKIGSSLGRIEASAEPMAELMRATYEHIHIEVDTIVHTKFSDGKLVLIGGIQLNIGKPFEDHFLPLSFRVLQTGKSEVDLLPKLLQAAAQ